MLMFLRVRVGLRIVASVATVVGPLSAMAQQPPTTSVAFVGVDVITMQDTVLRRDQTVVTRDGKIVAMGSRASVSVPRGAQQVDGRGKFLIPGLHDMHAHLAQGAGDLSDGAGRQLAVYTALGVTSVRALAAPPGAGALKRRVATGEIVAPRLWITGQSINGKSAPDAASISRNVASLAAGGADVIKTHGMWNDRSHYDTLVAAARRVRLPLAGHVTPEFGLAAAIDAGQQVEHLDGMIAATVPAGTPVPPGQFVFDNRALAAVDSARIDSLARVMAAKRIYHGPTLALFRVLADTLPPEYFLALPDVLYTPKAALDAWSLSRRQQAQQPIPPAIRQRYLAVRDQMVRRFQALGVPLLAGSDSPQFFLVAGFGVHRELQAMVQAGLTPYEALLSATRTPAEYLGRGTSAGIVATGRDADLVMLDGNPLRDIANTMRVTGTMLGGRWLPRAALDSTLQQVKQRIDAM